MSFVGNESECKSQVRLFFFFFFFCDSTGSSYSTHPGQLFQESTLVTRLHTPWKGSFKEGYFPFFSLQGQSTLLLCLCEACMHNANLAYSTTVRSPLSFFTEEIKCFFLKISLIFGKKITIIAHQFIKYWVKWRCSVILFFGIRWQNVCSKFLYRCIGWFPLEFLEFRCHIYVNDNNIFSY